MTNEKAPTREELDGMRMRYLRAELNRMERASRLMGAMGLVSLALLTILAISVYPRMEWQMIALLAFAGFCIALPLVRKFDLSKDGSGFETRDPLALIEAMQSRTEDARGESYEQMLLQIGAVSDQVKELSNHFVALFKSNGGRLAAADPSGDPGANPDELDEPSICKVRESLPQITVPGDPQKQRFGEMEEANGRRLEAKVDKSAMGDKWRKVTLNAIVVDGRPFDGKYVYFFLHDTFQPHEYKVKVDAAHGRASLEILAYGAFTAGAVADRGRTHLELDLATSSQISADEDWRKR
jgi:hypothetical protein